MKQAKLRKVGGSTMVAFPNSYLSALGIKAGESIDMSLNGRRIIIQRAAPRYTLEELLAHTPEDISQDIRKTGWLNKTPEGNEVL